MNLFLLPGAKSDLLDGIDWLEDISKGLGDRFQDEFFNCLKRIENAPNHFAENNSGYRACRLKRFTAVTYFKIDGDTIVIVRLLVNGKQDNIVEGG